MSGMNDFNDFWRNVFVPGNIKSFDAQTSPSVEFAFNSIYLTKF